MLLCKNPFFPHKHFCSFIFARYNLGYLYEEGLEVEQSYQKALHHYTLSAEKGFSSAQFALAALYRDGKGTPVDMEKAASLFFSSVQQHMEDAKEKLSNLLSKAKVEWRQEYHSYWKACDLDGLCNESFANKKFLNEQILTILLSSKHRKTSSFSYFSSFVPGVAMNVVKFLCHYRQQSI